VGGAAPFAQIQSSALASPRRSFVAIGVVSPALVLTIALEKCDRGATGALPRHGADEFGRTHQSGGANDDCRFVWRVPDAAFA
jgi:hypothetical protein